MANGIHVGLDEIPVHFEELKDPRSDVNQRHPLENMVVIAVLAILAGGRGRTAIARWTGIKKDLLLRSLPLPNGIPGSDSLAMKQHACGRDDAFLMQVLAGTST